MPLPNLFEPVGMRVRGKPSLLGNWVLAGLMGACVAAGAFGLAWQSYGDAAAKSADRNFLTLITVCAGIGYASLIVGAPMLRRCTRGQVSPWIVAAGAALFSAQWFYTLAPAGTALTGSDSYVGFYTAIGIGMLLVAAMLAFMDWRINDISRKAAEHG